MINHTFIQVPSRGENLFNFDIYYIMRHSVIVSDTDLRRTFSEDILGDFCMLPLSLKGINKMTTWSSAENYP